MSLKLRLSLFYGLFLMLVLSTVAVVVYKLTERSLLNSLEERSRQSLNDLAQGEETLTALRRLPGDTYFEAVVYPADILPLDKPSDFKNGFKISLPIDPSRKRPNPTEDKVFQLLTINDYEILHENDIVSTKVVLNNGETLLVMAVAGWLESFDVEHPAIFLVGVPASSVQGTLQQLKRSLRETIIIAFVIFVLSVWLLSARVLSPLRRITKAAELVTSKDLSQRVPVPKTRDELSKLALTINLMLGRLQESFETQRRFTADASHELRTPVTAIAGHASYLVRRTKLNAQQLESLKVIKEESDRMGKMVNDLLELARADAGFEVAKDPLNLVDILEDVSREIQPVAGDTKIITSAPEPIMEVLGDNSRLKQVVLNLVQNALNAGATQISLSLTKVKLKDSNKICLEVLDNGPGIPEQAIPHLFERFYRVDGARSTRGNGSGLGLSIVKWIVNQHQGSVSVESKVGEGSVFTILLPAHIEKNSTDHSLIDLRPSLAAS